MLNLIKKLSWDSFLAIVCSIFGLGLYLLTDSIIFLLFPIIIGVVMVMYTILYIGFKLYAEGKDLWEKWRNKS
jgi:hypothetical protein